MITIATGQNSPNCQEEDLINPVADNYFSHESIYSLCQEEAINMVYGKDQKSNYWLGKHRSEETNRKVSLSNKGKHYIKTEDHPMYGRRGTDNPRSGCHHTEEAKAKIRAARAKQTPWNKGKTTPQVQGKNSPHWKGGNKLANARTNNRRRTLGFIPINMYFDDAEGHHLDKENVMYIPKKIHQSIPHKLENEATMNKINILAFDWLNASVL